MQIHLHPVSVLIERLIMQVSFGSFYTGSSGTSQSFCFGCLQVNLEKKTDEVIKQLTFFMTITQVLQPVTTSLIYDIALFCFLHVYTVTMIKECNVHVDQLRVHSFTMEIGHSKHRFNKLFDVWDRFLQSQHFLSKVVLIS